MIFVMSSHQNAPIFLKGESIIKVMVGTSTIVIMVFVNPNADRRGDSSPSKTLRILNLFQCRMFRLSTIVSFARRTVREDVTTQV